MLTEDFEAGLEKLHALTAEGRVALMCAEAVPWRCHRSLIADALTARGAQVEHITSAKHSTPHCMTAFAEVDGTRVNPRVRDLRVTPHALARYDERYDAAAGATQSDGPPPHSADEEGAS